MLVVTIKVIDYFLEHPSYLALNRLKLFIPMFGVPSQPLLLTSSDFMSFLSTILLSTHGYIFSTINLKFQQSLPTLESWLRISFSLPLEQSTLMAEANIKPSHLVS